MIYRDCKPIADWKRSIRAKPTVQVVMKRDERNPRSVMMSKTASQLEILRSSMHSIFKNDLRLTACKSNSDRYFQRLPSRYDMTGAKGFWRGCIAPLASKCWQKKCYLESLKVLGSVTSSLKTLLRPTHRIWLSSGTTINSEGFWDKNMWPPSSPDPMDFAIWCIVKNDVPAKYCSSVVALKNTLFVSWSALDEEVVRRSCHSVTSSMELMVKAKRCNFIIWLL